MNKKDIFTIILKVLIYILTLLLGAVGAQALAACSSPYSTISHYGTVVINDTIYVSYGYK